MLAYLSRSPKDGQKKTFYKKTPFKKTSVDYEKKFKSLIKKTIVEKKEHKVVNKQFYQSGLNIVAFPSPTAAPTYSLAPDITQGAGQGGRLGNKISIIGHECIMHFCYKDIVYDCDKESSCFTCGI